MEIEIVDIQIKKCKYCNAPIPKVKIDTKGRKNTRTSDYCNNKGYCRNKYLTTKTYPDYFKKYYQTHKDVNNDKRESEVSK